MGNHEYALGPTESARAETGPYLLTWPSNRRQPWTVIPRDLKIRPVTVIRILRQQIIEWDSIRVIHTIDLLRDVAESSDRTRGINVVF